MHRPPPPTSSSARRNSRVVGRVRSRRVRLRSHGLLGNDRRLQDRRSHVVSDQVVNDVLPAIKSNR